MYQPWLAHYFPGLKPSDMEQIPWPTYLAMWDSIKDGRSRG